MGREGKRKTKDTLLRLLSPFQIFWLHPWSTFKTVTRGCVKQLSARKRTHLLFEAFGFRLKIVDFAEISLIDARDVGHGDDTVGLRSAAKSTSTTSSSTHTYIDVNVNHGGGGGGSGDKNKSREF